MGNLTHHLDVADLMKDAAGKGLLLAAEHVLGVAVERVPHEEGTLQNTGATDVDTETLTANVTFDGPYAVRQHEDLDLRHDEGRQAKYLESAALDESATVTAILAQAAKEALSG